MMKQQLLCSLLILSNFTLFAITNPIEGIYEIDAGHTHISFSVERFGMVMVTGQFTEVEGTIIYNSADITATKASVNIATKSLYSGHETRDSHLKGATWLDVENYPNINFETTTFEIKENQLTVTAQMTIRGITKEISFPIEIKGPYTDPTKKKTIAIAGKTTLNRQDFGISFNKTLDNGKHFIGNEIVIRFDALASLKK